MDITTSKLAKVYRLNAEQFKRLMKLPDFYGASLYETLGPNWRHLFVHPNTGKYYVIRGAMPLSEVLKAIEY